MKQASIKSLARRGMVVVALTTAKASGLLMTMAAARYFTGNELGVFFVILGLAALGGTIANLGLDQYTYKVFPEARAKQDDTLIRQSITAAILGSAVVTLLVAPYILFTAVQNTASTVSLLFVAGSMIFMASLRRLMRFLALLEGQRITSVAIELLWFNISISAVIGILWFVRLPIQVSPLWIASSSAIVSGIIALGWLARSDLVSVSDFGETLKNFRSTLKLYSLALPTLINQIWVTLFNRGDIVILASLSVLGEVAQYAMAVRVTYLLSVISELTSVLYGKQLSEAGQWTDAARRKRLVVRVLSYTIALVLALTFMVVVFAQDILDLLFGNAASGAATTLTILVIGKATTAALNPCQIMITSMGHNRQLAVGSTIGGAVFLVLAVFLVPQFGAMGLAISTLCGLFCISMNIIRILLQYGVFA